MMKLSESLTRWIWIPPMLVAYLLSLGGLALALRTIEAGIAYAVWAAAGTLLIALIGIVFFSESITPLKIVSIALVIAGVVGLNLARCRASLKCFRADIASPVAYTTVCARRALLVASSLFSRRFPPRRTPREVHGRVINSRDGQPLGLVQVALVGTSFVTVTDGEGSFRFASLPAGHYVLEATAVGYHAVRQEFTVAPEETKTFEKWC